MPLTAASPLRDYDGQSLNVGQMTGSPSGFCQRTETDSVYRIRNTYLGNAGFGGDNASPQHREAVKLAGRNSVWYVCCCGLKVPLSLAQLRNLGRGDMFCQRPTIILLPGSQPRAYKSARLAAVSTAAGNVNMPY